MTPSIDLGAALREHADRASALSEATDHRADVRLAESRLLAAKHTVRDNYTDYCRS